MPRPSWPLNLELQDFNGTLTVEATPRPGFEVPQLTTYLGRVEGVNSFLSFHHLTPIPFTRTPGGFFVRLLVTSEGGTDVTDDAAFELSQRMMGDTLCLFVENREQLGRCSNLELVPNLSHNNYSLLLPEGELVAPNLNSWEDQAASQ